ncbi:MAG TPA: ABC transporter permease [Marmoricola sp.]|nr:ABC transporter permease [Marmoricola sp.]
MLRLVLKQTLARRGRLALTLVAVALGVTFVTGSLVLTDTSNKVFDDQFATAASGVDVSVRDAVSFDSAMGVEVERDPLPPSLLDRVARLDGVADAAVVAKGSGLIQHRGEAIVPRGPSLLSSWSPAPFGSFELRSGREPRAGEVVVDAATAAEHDISIGDEVTVQSERVEPLEVVGLAGFGDRDGLPNTTVALVSTPTAQHLLGLGDRVSELLVVADEGTSTGALAERLRQEVGASYDVAASRDTADASAEAAKDQLEYLQIMLFVLAGAAFLIGGFLIANTFSIVVSQRTQEIAVLRAAGATGRQVLVSVLGEAVVVGAVGSAVGAGLGILAASGLREVASGFGVVVPESGLVVLPRTVAIAFALGLLVTLVSALGPARRAARVAPVAAMRAADSGSRPTRRRTFAGSAVAAVALGGVVLGLAGGPALLVASGAVLALVALVVLGPALTPALARVVGRPLRGMGVPGLLASQSAHRAPRRTAATALALAFSLALISFMAVLATSLKDSIRSSYAEYVSAELVVESARGEMLGGLAPMVHHHVEALDEVAVASRVRFGHWKDGRTTRALTAVDPGTIADVTRLEMVEGRISDLAGGGIVLSEQVAADRGLAVGDRLPMKFSRTGRQPVPVVGLMTDGAAQALSTDYIVSLGTYARHFSERMDASVYVDVADGVAVDAARAAVEEALAELPTAEVRDQQAAVDGRSAMVDQILGLVTVLLLFTVLIAMLGITNTLALSIIERTREIGLLRAVGMTRGQLRRMVRGEALLVAGIALVIGVLLGLGLAAAAVAVLGRSAPMAFSVPLAWLAGVLVLALVAGVLAGLLPARRAARLPVLEAVTAE